MKKSMKQIFRILIVMIVISFAISCSSQQNDKNQDHGEMLEGDDHMHEGEHSDEDMMNDTTSMEMNKGLEQ